MPRKNNSVFYVGGSVLLIMLAVAATAILSQSNLGGNQGAADIRAKAGITAALKATATVRSVDLTRGTITVNNLRFVESTGEISDKNLGSWVVTPPSGFNLATLGANSIITITISPQTFITSTHTVTATQIIVER